MYVFWNRQKACETRLRYLYKRMLVGLLLWGLTRMCLLAFSHQYQHKFLSKATYFSHMLQQRWEAKTRRKEISPQPSLELTATRSWVQHTHHWASRAGHVGVCRLCAIEINVEHISNVLTVSMSGCLRNAQNSPRLVWDSTFWEQSHPLIIGQEQNCFRASTAAAA